jgi:hypothetical protein
VPMLLECRAVAQTIVLPTPPTRRRGGNGPLTDALKIIDRRFSGTRQGLRDFVRDVEKLIGAITLTGHTVSQEMSLRSAPRPLLEGKISTPGRNLYLDARAASQTASGQATEVIGCEMVIRLPTLAIPLV